MPSTDPQRPNILMVVSDDQGPWALGCAGNDELVTPTLDALADDGVRLENLFCASPVCSPARGSLVTGRMPSAHGVHDWIRGEAYGIDEDSDLLYLEGQLTTPEVLSAAGWTCGYSGKWHLGGGRRPAPGFDAWYVHRTGDGPYVGAPVWRDGERYSEPRYLTDAITEEGLAFLEAQRESTSPFYLRVDYTAPHSPWVDQHPQTYLDLYRDCDFDSCPREEPHPWFSWEPGPVSQAMTDPRPSLQGYFASITAMDGGVARLLNHVSREGLRGSTVVVFTSDNGFSCGHHGIWGKGNATWPLNVWENSIRVPTIISQPGRLQQHLVVGSLTSACDFHPTLLDLAGVPLPEDPLRAGRSLAPLLGGRERAVHDTVFVFDEYGGVRMVRSERYKYVLRADGGPRELYDLQDDPAELENRADDPTLASVRQDLHSHLLDWFRAHVDADRDAFHRPVSGRGQLRPASRRHSDESTYYQGRHERAATREG